MKKLLRKDLPEPGLVEYVFGLSPQVSVLKSGDETPGIVADWSHCSSRGIRWFCRHRESVLRVGPVLG